MNPITSSTTPSPDQPIFDLPIGWLEQHPTLSPNAKLDAHLSSLAEMEIVENPADGDGRAWVQAVHAIDLGQIPRAGKDDTHRDLGSPIWRRGEDDSIRPTLVASGIYRFEIVFEVGEAGIEEGGMIFVLPEPYWSWTEAQAENPDAPGYTTARPRHDGVELVPLAGGAAFLVEEGRLLPGEQIDIVVGAGPWGTQIDEFAERGSEILIATDADGDGTRRWLTRSARIDVIAREGAAIIAFGPAEVGPGDVIEINLAIVDERGNRALWPLEPQAGSSKIETENSFRLERISGPSLETLSLSENLRLAGPRDQSRRIRFRAPEKEETIRLAIRGQGVLDGLVSSVNPIVVREANSHLIWADFHGHSQISDGTGTPDDYFRYARDIARLDAVALTDHDHWGVRPLDESPEFQTQILRSALQFHEPGRFITIPGYEWTSWIHGHRHVLYFEADDEGDTEDGGPDPARRSPIYSAVDPATDRPDELWNRLRGRRALTFAHHSAGEPVATDWTFPPDPELEPITEISSVHGMSEAADAPYPVYGAIEGNFIRDVLLRGARLGFIGSSDSHDGHPGLAQIAGEGQSGAAGIFTRSLDRAGIYDAMRSRRTFATNGIRPWLSVSIDEAFMGGTLVASPLPSATHQLRIRYEATAPIERIDLIRTGRIAQLEGDLSLTLDLTREIPRLAPGEFHYVRIIQADGGTAWSSPVFVDSSQIEN